MKSAKIFELLEKINRTIKNSDLRQIGKLETDLLLQHLRDLYQEVDALGTVKQEPVATVEQIKRITINPNQNILLTEEETKPVKQEPVIEKEEEPVAKPETKTGTSKNSINESATSVSSLNEKIKTGAKEVHHKLSTKPLKDLIDLNRKFIFQNELFKGNSETFSSAIQQIDTAADYTSALTYIETELHSKLNWEKTSQPVKLFMKLVKQKFGEE